MNYIIEIPFPYYNFTEFGFFVTLKDGTFIPEYYYDRIDDHHIQLKDNYPYPIDKKVPFRFTFAHKHGFFAIGKKEQTWESGPFQYDYYFDSPYDNIVDLMKRTRVFVDGQFIPSTLEYYKWDNETGKLSLSRAFDFGREVHIITVLCFYSGTDIHNHTRAMLPKSGYFEFLKKYADRLWDKNMFAAFLNGKLVSRDDIIDIDSRIHKISRDLKTRNDFNVFNMSPSVSFLAPFLRVAHSDDKNQHEWIYEMPCKLNVAYNGVYTPRYYIDPQIIDPVEFNSMIPKDGSFYITIVHHGTNKTPHERELNYTLKFFRDEYEQTPEQVGIFAQLRIKGNNEPEIEDSATSLRVGTLPATMGTRLNDQVLFSFNSKLVYDTDEYNREEYKDSAWLNGIEIRFEIQRQMKEEWTKCYYELRSNDYEYMNVVNIFTILISSGVNGTGKLYYTKPIFFLPYNEPDPVVVPDVEFEYDD